jgi:methionyl-tRNA formyltransferase
MKKMSETIIFFGSGPVAAESLKLLAADFNIEAVITKPKPDHYKGVFPVIEVTQQLGIRTLYTKNKAELSDLFSTEQIKSPLGIVIDHGILIGQDVIDCFPLGIVNSHFSLLPEWRGADPISFSILSGQKRTGVSLMLINQALDDGPLLAQAEYLLPQDITTPELTDELINLSHQTLTTILPLYIKGDVEPIDQLVATISDSKIPTYSRKLTKQDGILDFANPAEQLEREIRAFTGWPRSRTIIGDIDVVVTRAHVINENGSAGSLWQKPKQLGIYTSKGILVIDTLIPAGKKEMSAEAFLAGYNLGSV